MPFPTRKRPDVNTRPGSAALRRFARASAPSIPIIVTLPQLIERASWQDRILAVLFLGFAVLALTLASIGLYAALSYTVSLHQREILAGALLLTRLLQSQLFAISPHDPVTYAVTPLVLLTVAMLAAYLPARRATRVDPVAVLRCE